MIRLFQYSKGRSGSTSSYEEYRAQYWLAHAKDNAKAPVKGRSGSFRDKLKKLTGGGRHLLDQAHHVIPNAFKWTIWRMSGGQINVDDPKYGSWWKSADHLKNAAQYNKDWAKWLAENRKAGTKETRLRKEDSSQVWTNHLLLEDSLGLTTHIISAIR